MLPPHELKSREFSKSMRGYNPVEVDEHIDFIIEKYTELYRENDEMERKLRIALAQIDAYKNEEESIRNALVNAQKAGASIISEANERADVILRSAKTNCDRILSEFSRKIKTERDTLNKLQRVVSDFKAQLFETYQQHIEYIENINSDVPVDDISIQDENYSRVIVSRIKEDIKNNAVSPEKVSDSDLLNAPDDVLDLESISIPEAKPADIEYMQDKNIHTDNNLPVDDDILADIPDELFAETPETVLRNQKSDESYTFSSDEITGINKSSESNIDDFSDNNFSEDSIFGDLPDYDQPTRQIDAEDAPKMSVKDAILNLNQSINKEHKDEDILDEYEDKDHDNSEEMSDEDLFRLLQETLDSSDESEIKDAEDSDKSQLKKKNSNAGMNDNLSVTDALDLVFPDNDNPLD